jgi:hypothetical protein
VAALAQNEMKVKGDMPVTVHLSEGLGVISQPIADFLDFEATHV